MIPAETEQLWQDYLAAERVRIRQEMLKALDRFIAALLKLPTAHWYPWAREVCRRIVDEHDDVPVRLALFRDVLFPALLAGLEQSMPGSSRWLAGFAQLLYKCGPCRDRLPEELRSEYGLLRRAIADDPGDTSAKTCLVRLMRSRFEYVLHELPTGVLYGHNGASAAECNELLCELSDYERLAVELGSQEEDLELIAEARFHIPAYQRYLSKRHRFSSYEDFLATNEHA